MTLQTADPGDRSTTPSLPGAPGDRPGSLLRQSSRRLHPPARRSRGLEHTRLVDGEWIPTAPQRARYLLGAADIDHFAQSHGSLHAPAFADSVPPIIDAGLVDPVETAWPSL